MTPLMAAVDKDHSATAAFLLQEVSELTTFCNICFVYYTKRKYDDAKKALAY